MGQTLRVGCLLDHGKYRVERILGQGGFGITYLVKDIALEKFRAIKEFFPKDFCNRDETTSMVLIGTSSTVEFTNKLKHKFIKEARNIAQLDGHNGVIKIHSVFEENNTAYYVMDYIDGESLSSMVRREGPLPLERALKYLRQIGDSLRYVHSHSINHLDIKPANIMIERKDDRPVLIDFGLSKRYNREGEETTATSTGTSHGFAPYEQYLQDGVKDFSPETDIYALGATLYYMIAGEIPPHALELSEKPLEFPNHIPENIRVAIREAMSFSKKNRPSSVDAFLSSLDFAPENHEDESTILAQEDKTGKLSYERGAKTTRNSQIFKLSFSVLGILTVVAALVFGYRYFTALDYDPDGYLQSKDPSETLTMDLQAEKENAETGPPYEELDEDIYVHSNLVDGWNTFHGSFNFEGAEYPFLVEFYYDASRHQVNEATYTATGTGLTNKITTLSFSDHDNNVTILGPSLNISATRDPNGKYIGTMTRGNHSGTIEMTL